MTTTETGKTSAGQRTDLLSTLARQRESLDGAKTMG
jgi:hypothetical protein